jgi:hypothetical protein
VAKRPATRCHRRNDAGRNHSRGGGGYDLEVAGRAVLCPAANAVRCSHVKPPTRRHGVTRPTQRRSTKRAVS